MAAYRKGDVVMVARMDGARTEGTVTAVRRSTAGQRNRAGVYYRDDCPTCTEIPTYEHRLGNGTWIVTEEE